MQKSFSVCIVSTVDTFFSFCFCPSVKVRCCWINVGPGFHNLDDRNRILTIVDGSAMRNVAVPPTTSAPKTTPSLFYHGLTSTPLFFSSLQAAARFSPLEQMIMDGLSMRPYFGLSGRGFDRSHSVKRRWLPRVVLSVCLWLRFSQDNEHKVLLLEPVSWKALADCSSYMSCVLWLRDDMINNYVRTDILTDISWIWTVFIVLCITSA